MFNNLKHKLKIKKLNRELELKQLHCNHYYEYYGEDTEYSYNGYDCDSQDIFITKCLKCNHYVNFYNKNNLNNFINFQNKKLEFNNMNKGDLNDK